MYVCVSDPCSAILDKKKKTYFHILFSSLSFLLRLWIHHSSYNCPITFYKNYNVVASAQILRNLIWNYIKSVDSQLQIHNRRCTSQTELAVSNRHKFGFEKVNILYKELDLLKRKEKKVKEYLYILKNTEY